MAENFGKIALCLSGGGYRAATFHLGTLEMLNNLELLDDVTMLSTVSGGTILGASYAAWRINQNDNKKFDEFYEEFYRFLTDTNVISEVLENLSHIKQNNVDSEVSLIKEAAKLYAEKAPFKKLKLGDFYDNNKPKLPFKELIFNATEFFQGNAFRFRVSHKPKAKIGNNNCFLDKEQAKNIYLADIVAASSCFPTAFEPLIFPKDFQGLDGQFKDQKDIALMDGGIFDNQGIASMLLANSTKKNASQNSEITETEDTVIESKDVDLIIISDTNQRSDEILKPHINFDLAESLKTNVSPWLAEKTKLPINNLTSQISNLLSWIGIGVSLILTIYGGFLLSQIYKFITQTPYSFNNFVWMFFVYYLPFSIACLLLFFIYQLFQGKKKLEKWLANRREIEIKGYSFKLLEAVKHITINDLANLLMSRISSLVSMSANVFMKAIRSLQVTGAMQQDVFNKRIAFNYIYDLNPTKNRTSFWKKDADLKPTEQMILIADKAEEVDTTLWFGDKEKDKLKLLVVCGRMTVCLSLLKFLLDNNLYDPLNPTNKHKEVYLKIKKQWMEYKALDFAANESLERIIETFYEVKLSGK